MYRRSWIPQLVALLLCSAFLVSCAMTHKVVPASQAPNGNVIYYALPRAVVTATVVVSVSEVKKKPRCDRAEMRKALNLERPKFTGKYFTLHKVILSKRAEADPKAKFAVLLETEGSNALGLTLNINGALTKGSSESTDYVLPSILGATKFAASVVGAALFGNPKKAPEPKLCGEIQTAIVKLRNRIQNLYSTQGAADSKDIIELKVAKLAALQKKLEYYFTGIKLGSAQKLVFEIRPTKPGKFKLFKYSMANGVNRLRTSCVGCRKKKAPPSLRAAATSTDPKVQSKLEKRYKLFIRIKPTGSNLTSVPKIEGPSSTTSERSYFYRIPAFARVYAVKRSSENAGTPVSDFHTWAIPQLGVIHSLPRITASGSASVTVTLDAETGALLEASVKKKAADIGGALNTLAGIVTETHQARKAAQKDVELERLKREQAILEAQVAIEAAKAALDASD